ncbi:MAG: hypothetical protein KY453_03805 [Gemmatimonadetes bacterium]|nr:hypothetical protein [Gemmatimonadota bacterium]
MSKFALYLIGYVIFVAGVGLAMNLLGIPPMWIGVTVLILVGLGIAGGANKTKQDDVTAG